MEIEKTKYSVPYSLIIKEKFFENLEKIVDYISIIQQQPLNAIKIGDGINETMLKIIDNPLIYSECENIPSKTKIYREVGYKTWLIIFKIKNNKVIILGVLSSKQKPSSFKKLS